MNSDHIHALIWAGLIAFIALVALIGAIEDTAIENETIRACVERTEDAILCQRIIFSTLCKDPR